MKDVSGDALDEAARDLSALISDIGTLRIYVSLDEMPFALLDALHTHLMDLSLPMVVHVCTQSLLRPALQIVYESLGLERGLVSTIRKWHALNTSLKFFFLLPDAHINTTPEDSSSYQEVDLLPAIKGLAKGSLELSKILALAEGSSSVGSGNADNNCVSGMTMDLDHYL